MSFLKNIFGNQNSGKQQDTVSEQNTPANTPPPVDPSAETQQSIPTAQVSAHAADAADERANANEATKPNNPLAGLDPTSLVIDTVPIAPGAPIPTFHQSMDNNTRPLTQDKFSPVNKNAQLTFAQLSDVGMMRTNNQDAVLGVFATGRSAEERPDFGVFIVADGMGGHQDGEKASAAAVRVMAQHVMEKVYKPILLNEEISERTPITEAMTEAAQVANEQVIASVRDGGTTLSAVVLVGELAYIAHVGDSRIYLINQDGIEQITRDHSLVQRLLELDQITAEEAAGHIQKNVLYRALGQNDSLEIDTLTRRIQPNTKLVLCSDGLWGLVKDHEILEIINAYPNAAEACERLVALANTRGGSDNITVLIVRMPN
jgi:PPM family protein phosphatase